MYHFEYHFEYHFNIHFEYFALHFHCLFCMRFCIFKFPLPLLLLLLLLKLFTRQRHKFAFCVLFYFIFWTKKYAREDTPCIEQETERTVEVSRSRGTVTPWTRDTVIAFTLLRAGAPNSGHARATHTRTPLCTRCTQRALHRCWVHTLLQAKHSPEDFEDFFSFFFYLLDFANSKNFLWINMKWF